MKYTTFLTYFWKILSLFVLLSLCQCSSSSQRNNKINSDETQFQEYVKITNLSIEKDLEWAPVKKRIDQNKFSIKTYKDTLVILEHLNNIEDFYGFEISLNNDKIVKIESFKP